MGAKKLLRFEIHGSQDPETNQLLKDLRLFGDRTSSFITTYPGFLTFRTPKILGQIRYVKSSKTWIAATEPLAAVKDRALLFFQFAQAAKAEGKRVLQTPVGGQYARELEKRGFYTLQIGAEAVFELGPYLLPAKEIAQRFPHSRSLKERGAKVLELDAANLSPETEMEMRTLVKRRFEDKRIKRLNFLNQVEPFHLLAERKIFALYVDGMMVAFLSTTPIYPNRSIFFAECIRDRRTRAGTVDFLFLESMRLLKGQGVKEVRMGTCLFAELPTSPGIYTVMNWLYRFGKFPVNFKSAYTFRNKFQPTRWEPVFLVADRPVGPSTAADLGRVVLGRSLLKSFLSQVSGTMIKLLPKLSLAFLLVASVGVFFALGLDSYFELDSIKRFQSQWVGDYRAHPLFTSSAFFVIFTVCATLPIPIPITTVLTVAAGALFEPWLGAMLASVAGTLGATLAFLSTRFVLRDFVRDMFRERLAKIDSGLKDQGFYYLVTLRLLPVMPVPAVNMLMGVTSIPLWTYVWVSHVSMFLVGAIYFYAGMQLSDVHAMKDILKPGMIAALVLLSFFPWAARKFVVLMRTFRDQRPMAEPALKVEVKRKSKRRRPERDSLRRARG